MASSSHLLLAERENVNSATPILQWRRKVTLPCDLFPFSIESVTGMARSNRLLMVAFANGNSLTPRHRTLAYAFRSVSAIQLTSFTEMVRIRFLVVIRASAVFLPSQNEMD